MLVLTEDIIRSHYFMNDAITDLKQGLISKRKGFITNPHRTVIDIEKHQASSLYMPSADLLQEVASIKVVTIFPENPKQGKPTTQGILLLTDSTTGEHVCMMNASYLTRLRTGALSGIGTSKLARTNSKTLGVIGTGAMAFEQVLGVLEVRPIETILLFNRTNEKANKFKQKLIDFGIEAKISVLESVTNVVKSADIICCSTRSNEPVFVGNDLQEGTHINGVGSYLPTMREVDLTTIKKADKIVVDDLDSVKHEAGELIHAAESSDFSFTDIHGELCELSMDNSLNRESEKEITFFKSVGAAYFDLVVAKGIYQKAKELNLEMEIKM